MARILRPTLGALVHYVPMHETMENGLVPALMPGWVIAVWTDTAVNLSAITPDGIRYTVEAVQFDGWLRRPGSWHWPPGVDWPL